MQSLKWINKSNKSLFPKLSTITNKTHKLAVDKKAKEASVGMNIKYRIKTSWIKYVNYKKRNFLHLLEMH